MRLVSYCIFLRKEPEGEYTVTVPTLPGCVTYGETIDEAIEMAREAIELYIEHLQEKGEEIPTEEGLLEYTPHRRSPCLNFRHSRPRRSSRFLRRKGLFWTG